VTKTTGGSGRDAADRPSDEVLITRAQTYLTLARACGIFVILVGLGVFVLLAVPLAHAIAGKHTDFGMTVSVSFNAVLTTTTALAGAGLAAQSHRVRHYKNRTRRLERQVQELGQSDPDREGQ
jgi:hypothetical protein